MAGATISKLRCSLDSSTADMLIFINKNMRDHPEFCELNKVVGQEEEDDSYMNFMYGDSKVQDTTTSSTEYPSLFRAPAVPEPVGIDSDMPRPSTSSQSVAGPALPSLFLKAEK